MPNIYEVMANRRSTRKYKSTPIGNEVVERITNAGLLAPSGADRLPFTYICVSDPIIKKQIQKGCEEADKAFHGDIDEKTEKWMKGKGITNKKPFLTQAPVLLIIAGDTTHHYWLESTWISISYALLAAENESIATVTYTPTDPKFLNDIVGLPDHFEPQVILPLGYPDEELGPKKPRAVGKVFWQRYGE